MAVDNHRVVIRCRQSGEFGQRMELRQAFFAFDLDVELDVLLFNVGIREFAGKGQVEQVQQDDFCLGGDPPG